MSLLFIVLLILLASLVLGLAVWGGFALWYQCPGPRWVRLLVMAAWSLPALATLAALAGAGGASGGWALAFVLALVVLLWWWRGIRASHDRVWADDVACMLVSQVNGDRVRLDNVRNFEWRSETDYDVRWESRDYDLSQLVSADLLLSYWMGPAIAHTLVSFGFADGRRLVFSLEIRRERGESFSALGGFFRKFEAVIVAADERDIVRTRTNARGEDVYLYRLQLRPDQLRKVFLGYLERAAQLRAKPRFYNTLTSNCTTIVFELARRLSPSLPLDYRLLLSGYFAGYVFDHGVLTPGYRFDQLRQAGRITERALQSAPGDDYSKLIRLGVPGVGEDELR
ncbi:DUF4105 domain-containing protein [Herbaspirillum sp. AP02]|uniref:Lnb N-terminal periplasmic domain-containing protein n=1 Tax=unclassified Herbaspirillum TaxID=2624150 RepID=UPI0015DA1C76|nr:MULTISPECIES: DUF4105 domain-containing protein [unclassified Herbaspirillum]MBG7621454.1 DUF4105 domain-containing protein [Herbaspirillum sp. AP02]NZD67003.1 DUF4105 domain-containing protein [Herbaspirillum sp. AP21]